MIDEHKLAKRAEKQARWRVERRRVIDDLERAVGPGPVPLSWVAQFLPDNPEWAEYATRRRA